MAYLYRHIRLDKDEPFYIGIGSDETYRRAYSLKNRNKYWKNIIKKTEYIVEIMIDDLTWEQVCEKEKEFILLYGRKDLKTGTLVNLTDGGEGVIGLICSNETRLKMKNSQLGKKQSIEQIEKRISKLKGSNNPWYGKTLTKKHRDKLSKSKLGKSRNPTVMKKLHDSLKKEVTDGINIFKSLGDAAVYYKVHQTTITRWVNRNHNNLKMI